MQLPYNFRHGSTQQKRDMLQLYNECDGNTKHLNKLCKQVQRYNQRFTPMSVLGVKVDSATKDDKLKEVLEYLKVECRKLCRNRKLSAVGTRTILGRLGLVRGYEESYDELQTELEVDKNSLQQYWHRHGESVRSELQSIYYA